MSTTSSPTSSRSSSRSSSPQRRISRSVCFPRHLNCLESFENLSAIVGGHHKLSNTSWPFNNNNNNDNNNSISGSIDSTSTDNVSDANLNRNLNNEKFSNSKLLLRNQQQLESHNLNDNYKLGASIAQYDHIYHHLERLNELNQSHTQALIQHHHHHQQHHHHHHNSSNQLKRQLSTQHRQAFFLPDDDDDDDDDVDDGCGHQHL